MIPPRRILFCFYKATVNTINHDGIEHAGYLAFLGLLAVFPFLVFIVALAGFLGEGQIGAHYISLAFTHLPSHFVSGMKPRVEEILSGPPQGLLTVAILGAIWTASSAVEGYRTVLNRAYHVNTPPAYIWRRLLSIAQLLIFSFILIIGIFLLVTIPIFWEKIEMIFGINPQIFEGTSWGRMLLILSGISLFFVVCNLYFILPNIKQAYFSVMPGAALVVMLWIVAAFLFSVYLSNFDQVNLIYGGLGGIIATLLFFYINNVIFIYGAELNYLLKKALGERIVQKESTTEPQPVDDEN